MFDPGYKFLSPFSHLLLVHKASVSLAAKMHLLNFGLEGGKRAVGF